jgi:TRAP-type uncharacterized transport system fused permease subunit
MIMAIEKFLSLVLTASMVVFGIAGIIMGICTATGHNVVLGAMILVFAYGNIKL